MNNNQAWHFGNIWTDNIKQAHELQIIQAGPNHKWWTSARLLLGIDEETARKVHYDLNHEVVYTFDVEIQNDNTRAHGGFVDIWDVPHQEPISYIDKLMA